MKIYLKILLLSSFLIASCHKDKFPDFGIRISDYSIDGNSKLYAASFYNDKFGVILGRFNNIYITYDGAQTWQKKVYDVGSLIYFFSVEAINNQTVLCGQEVIYKSNDVCNSWNLLSFPEVGPRIKDFYFFDDSTGFYCTDKIYKTYNQGADWFQVYPTGSVNGTGFNVLQEILFPFNDSVGYAYGGFSFEEETNGVVLKTVNKGNDWLRLDTQFQEIKNMVFMNDTTSIVFTFYRYIYKTTDSGKTWHLVNESCPCTSPRVMYFKESGIISIACKYELYASVDQGESWTKYGEVPSDIVAVSKLTDKSFVAVGEYGGIYLINEN